MKVRIWPRSTRTFFEALAKAGLPEPTSPAGPALDREIGNLWLTLLTLGIDHERVGSRFWMQRILEAAHRPRRRGADHHHHVDAWLTEQQRFINARNGTLLPVLVQRQALVDHLARLPTS